MQQQKFNYITCYRKKDGYIYIYLKHGERYRCKITKSTDRRKYYLSFLGKYNDILFTTFHINKYDLTFILPGQYYEGDWPESKTEEELFDLLRALIKETKKRYYLATEL